MRLWAFAALAALLTATGRGAEPAPPRSAADILEELRSFREQGSVLYIAAHPDDENTQLIAYLARGRGFRTGYLSLTRGEGGQNLIGPDLGDALGVIRTQELLAARRIDGGIQFFSRARDFGFCKDYRQALAKWGREPILADVVRVIRTFQPDVIITRFSTVPGMTHGHHTASAVLALEAFRMAADPKAFPEQLGELAPWQAKRILWNSTSFGPRAPGLARGDGSSGSPPPALRLDIGGFSPLLGESYGEIAALSRSMHRTQGFGMAGTRGERFDAFQVLAGVPATRDIFEGIDLTWGRWPGGAKIGALTDEAIARFNPQAPVASVPTLLELRSSLDRLKTSLDRLGPSLDRPGTKLDRFGANRLLDEKRRQLDRILQACLGLYVESVTPEAEGVPGEALDLTHTAIVRTPFAVRWLGPQYPDGTGRFAAPVELRPNRPEMTEDAPVLPASTPISQPYWLRAPGTEGRFRVDDPSLIGQPENPPVFPIAEIFEVGGQTLAVPDAPVQVVADPSRGEIRRKLIAIPPVTLDFSHDLELFAPGATRPVTVNVSAARSVAAGILRLKVPAGWTVTPAARPFQLAAGARAGFAFAVTAPPRSDSARIGASVEIGGARYDTRRIELRYDHIPVQVLQPAAELRAVSIELAIRGRRVGYLQGAGDAVDECLARMGYAVVPLSGADLTPEGLRGLDAVVLGIRVFNTRTDLAGRLPALFAYVEGGGTVVAQYNTPNGLRTDRLAPFDLALSRNLPAHRVTDENAPVTLLAPDHPAFQGPNKIVPTDFDGWVQERGLNFPDRWDRRFTPLLACSDPGEAPLRSGILVARDGRGYFVYTGISWFRQLPAGVPGAYRLFANLVSLGK